MTEMRQLAFEIVDRLQCRRIVPPSTSPVHVVDEIEDLLKRQFDSLPGPGVSVVARPDTEGVRLENTRTGENRVVCRSGFRSVTGLIINRAVCLRIVPEY